MKLLHVDEMPHLPFVRVPQDLFIVLDEPVLLAGMAYPAMDLDWEGLYEFGFKSVISLAEDIPEYHPSPLSVTHSVRMQDLEDGTIPRNPPMEKKRIKNAVQSAINVLDEESGVIIHCVGGTGRTGTVIGCLLVEMDFERQEVVDYLDSLHRARGKTGGWPETLWQSRVVLEWGTDIATNGSLPELGVDLSADESAPDSETELPPDLFPPD